MKNLAIGAYEIRRLLRDRALAVLLLLLTGLSGYAAWTGAAWVQEREAAIALIKADEEERLSFTRGFAETQIVVPAALAVLPPGAMAPLSIGQADNYPYHAEVLPLGDYTMLFKRVWEDIGSPSVRAAGRFDLAFVIVFLLPLVILAATYDLWSRERERGVSAMILSQPVAIGSLIVMKAAGRGLVLLLPTTAIMLVVSAAAGAREPAGLAALALLVLVYGAFWLAVAVLINLVTRRSTEAAIGAGAVWLLLVVMAPSLGLAAVNLAAPAPSEMLFATELKTRVTTFTESQRREEAANPTRKREPAPTIPDSRRDAYADLVARDDLIATLIAAHQQAKDARRLLFDRLRLFLPSVAMQDALDRIAGSDADRALEFERQARAAQLELRHAYKWYLDRDALVTPVEYDALSGFRFRESAGYFQAGVLADLAALIIATLLVLLTARALRGRATTP